MSNHQLKRHFVSIFAIALALTVNVKYAQAKRAFAADNWQQTANYNIDVTLDDLSHRLEGQISIEYHNNSPDTLRSIFLHLWPNAFKDQSSAFAKQKLGQKSTDFYYALKSERGHIAGFDFKVNDQQVQTSYYQNNEVVELALKQGLLPGTSIDISTPFSVKIPNSFSRLGHIDQSYQITQWYPKPAVYAPSENNWEQDQSRKNKWYTMPYLDQGEFYSEFGDFNVRITVPQNYVVAASGDLQNESELEWLTKKDKETRTLDTFETDLSIPPSAAEFKTLHYELKQAHDFAWFADKRFHVLKSDLKIKGREDPITTWSFFTNEEADLWTSSPDYIEAASTFYSEKVGMYPYNQVSAVQSALSAGAGMEYPTITVIGEVGTARNLERLIVHEVGHNWFYGILASNERDYPWMDEGINSYYEERYFRERYESNDPGDYYGMDSKLSKRITNDYNLHELNQWMLVYMSRKNYDQPVCSHSTHLSDINYGLMVYRKAAIAFRYLENYLGQKSFDQIMQSYYNKFAFAHPQPRHIRQHIEYESGRNLEWFFDDLLSTTKDSDYRLMGASLKGNKIGETDYDLINVMNFHSQQKGPFSISAVRDSTVVRTIWYEGFTGRMDVAFPAGTYDYYQLDALGLLTDKKPNNNRLNAKNGRRAKPKLKTKFLGSIEKKDKRYLFWTPFLGFNNYDKLMPGLTLYNNVAPGKNFEFLMTPMYSTKAKTLVGQGEMNYRLYPENTWFQEIKIGLEAQRFHHAVVVDRDRETRVDIQTKPYVYEQLVPQVKFKFRNKSVHSTLNKSVELRHNRINKGPFSESPDSSVIRFIGGLSQREDYYVNKLNFELDNHRIINPFTWKVELEQHPRFGKITSEFEYKFTYRKKKKGLSIRAFVGGFLWNDLRGLTPVSDDRLYEFKPSGNNGDQDYLFEHYFLGRQEFEGLMSQQIIIKDGGLRARTDGVSGDLGTSGSYMYALNFDLDFPKKLPFSLYWNLVKSGENPMIRYTDFRDELRVFDYAEIGVALKVVPDIVEIYFPLIYNQELEGAVNLTSDTYFKKISFMIDFNRMRLIKNLRDQGIDGIRSF